MEKAKYTTITIPIQLADKLKNRIEGTGFNSLSSYVTYVLRQVLASTEKKTEETLTPEQEKRIKDNLRALGYIK